MYVITMAVMNVNSKNGGIVQYKVIRRILSAARQATCPAHIVRLVHASIAGELQSHHEQTSKREVLYEMNWKLRQEIKEIMDSEDGWHIVWPAGEMPISFLDDEVKVIYEDNTGLVRICEAIYTRTNGPQSIAFFKRKKDGSRLTGVFAWKRTQWYEEEGDSQ
jgi:hypothetical protein